VVHTESPSSNDREIRVHEIIGCFLTFFGILLLVAAATQEKVPDKITNLLAALILAAIGLGMFWRGVARHRRAWRLPVAIFTALAVAAAAVALCVTRAATENVEEAPVKTKETQDNGAETRARQIKQEESQSAIVQGLQSLGWTMRSLVERVPLSSVRLFTVIGFVVIAGVVWLVRRETVFGGFGEKDWWRDPRLWTLVIAATQVVIYLLLGT
jgi:cation transport ATPase